MAKTLLNKRTKAGGKFTGVIW